jgi:hypothetical protein
MSNSTQFINVANVMQKISPSFKATDFIKTILKSTLKMY